MKKIKIETACKKMLADVYTPVGIYLRLRDRFRDTILLESADSHAGENSCSIIGINAIAGIEIRTAETLEYKLPGLPAEKKPLNSHMNVQDLLWQFMQRFEVSEVNGTVKLARDLYGYISYDAVQFFENISVNKSVTKQADTVIPLMRYRLYQYVIIFNHFKDELCICENKIQGIESETEVVESLIKSRNVPEFTFSATGQESPNITDEAYLQMVRNGIAHCSRGDVFQVVLSRRFHQEFTGDEFNVYRALRSINPGPYLFYFDYGDYKLMGSSPEAQLIIENGTATVHPIAGTVIRTGNDDKDKEQAMQLKQDVKENAEHVMLVDLARNDLSRLCGNVLVTAFKKINFYSHVIHLVSEVSGSVAVGGNPFHLLGAVFPAGTLSGAPKFKAMQLIDTYEVSCRGYYGGAIGSIGLDGRCNHAIMIRSFLSKHNTLFYQAGAGIVVNSKPENELAEVNNKLKALKKAIELAQII